MRTRFAPLLALSIAGLMAVAGPAAAASKTVRVHGPHFKVALPPIGQCQITLETVKTKAPKAVYVKALKLHPGNVSHLPSSASLAAAIGPKSAHKRTVTFKIYVFVCRGFGTTASAHSAATSENFVDVETDVLDVIVHLVAHRSHPHNAFTAFDKGIQDCALAWAAGFYGDGIWSDAAWASLQSSFNQPSPPERVIDNIVDNDNLCHGKAQGPNHELPEGDDPGDG